ncbi:MAG: cytochrome [Nonomuraea sp.]|nr:cytochrome [Nonomuraea sp.]
MIATLVVPTVAQGVIIRRPAMTAAAARLDLDGRAVRLLRGLREKYGKGPLLVPIPLRPFALVLSPGDVRRVLSESPEPFALDSREKRAALAHFEPGAVLVSHGRRRSELRSLNERLLDPGRHGERHAAVVRAEIAPLLDLDTLTWDDFAPAWWRAVRRIVLGHGARHDERLTGLLARLRSDGNWSYAKPRRHRLRREFAERLSEHVARHEAGSLVESGDVDTLAGQAPHWLFAYDAAGAAIFRALALLSVHPGPHDPRAAVLESLRLWPTTLVILRDSTTATGWDGGPAPRQTPFVIYSPFANRDHPAGGRYTPGLWQGAEPDWPIVPFSRGPGACPGRDLVLLTASAALETLAAGRHRLLTPRLDPGRELPYGLDHFAIRFGRQGGPS